MTLRISVTTLEAYRLFIEGDWMPEADLIANIKRESVATPAMELGIDYHSILEDPDLFEWENCYQRGDRIFSLEAIDKMLAKIDRKAGLSEVKATKQIGGVNIVGKADFIQGTHITEFKTTERAFDSEKYSDSYQWRFLMLIFGVQWVTYQVAQLQQNADGEYELADEISSMDVYAYPNMFQDCLDLLQKFLGYIAARGLEPYLAEKETVTFN